MARMPVLLNLPIASRSDDQRDNDVRRRGELDANTPPDSAMYVGDRVFASGRHTKKE